MLYRVGFNVLIALLLCTVSWYVYGAIIIAGFFLFDDYIEGIAWGISIDAIFTGGANMHYFYTIIVSISYLIATEVKKYIRYYD